MLPNIILGEDVPLSYFMPGDFNQKVKGDVLKGTLESYEKIIALFLQALNHLLSNDLYLFDGHVGDNACQIRAEMFATLFNNSETHKIAKAYINQLREARALVKMVFIASTHSTFNTIYSENKLEVKISKMMAAACLSYILCITKHSTMEVVESSAKGNLEILSKGELCPNKLIVEGCKESKSFSDKFLKVARAKLAEFSVQYVQQLGMQLPPSQEVTNLNLWVSEKYVYRDKDHRWTVPCFAFTDIVMRSSLSHSTGVLLKWWNPNLENLKNKNWSYLFYRVLWDQDSGQPRYVVTPIPSNRKFAVMVKECICIPPKGSFISAHDVAEQKLEDIVLGNEAVHPQYPGKPDPVPADPERFAKYKSVGEKMGLGRDNPYLCFVEHEYPDTLEHQWSLLGSTNEK